MKNNLEMDNSCSDWHLAIAKLSISILAQPELFEDVECRNEARSIPGVKTLKTSVLLIFYSSKNIEVVYGCHEVKNRITQFKASSVVPLHKHLKKGFKLAHLTDTEKNIHNVLIIDFDGAEHVLPNGKVKGLFLFIGRLSRSRTIAALNTFKMARFVHLSTDWPCVIVPDADEIEAVSGLIKQRLPNYQFVFAREAGLDSSNAVSQPS